MSVGASQVSEEDARRSLEEHGWKEKRQPMLWKKGPLFIPFVELRRNPAQVIAAAEALEGVGLDE